MFIFFQLKLYISILLRWKQYNQIVIIENVCNNEFVKPNTEKNHSSSAVVVVDMNCVEK